MFARIKVQKAFAVTVNKCTCGNHLAVKHGLFGKESPKTAAMGIRPFHHGGGSKAAIQGVFIHGVGRVQSKLASLYLGIFKPKFDLPSHRSIH